MTRRSMTHSSNDEAEVQRFEELTLPHLPALYRLAVRLKGDPQDAEDLVQETYVKALRAFPTLRQPDRVKSWIFQILSRLVLDQHRSKPREIAVGDLEELDRFCLYDLVWEEDPFPYSERLSPMMFGSSLTGQAGWVASSNGSRRERSTDLRARRRSAGSSSGSSRRSTNGRQGSNERR